MTTTVQDFDFSVDALAGILWEHDSAERLVKIARLKQAWYDKYHAQFWADWVRDVFDIKTANDFGLAVWARILDVQLGVTVPATTGQAKFGFGTGALRRNFNRGNFGRGGPGTQGLTTAQKRLVIRMRYFQLIARGTVPETNRFLADLFGAGAVYVLDPYDMTFVTFVFTATPDSQVKFVLDNYDLLPRPSGVGVRYITQPRPAFGFGVLHRNFNRGSFGA